jgi:DNA-binding response OmpR family regulator
MQKRILIAEDDPVGRRALVDFFTARGFTVDTATHGQEALERFASDRPDLVLLDVLLPRRSGFEVCFDIRRAAGRKVPVVLMSAVCRDVHDARYAERDLGADDYFVKPFRLPVLLTRVRELLATAEPM